MNSADDNQVMTIQEVADFLRFSESKVYRLVKKGELPGKKIGGQWRIWKPTLEAFMEERGMAGRRPTARRMYEYTPLDG